MGENSWAAAQGKWLEKFGCTMQADSLDYEIKKIARRYHWVEAIESVGGRVTKLVIRSRDGLSSFHALDLDNLLSDILQLREEFEVQKARGVV